MMTSLDDTPAPARATDPNDALKGTEVNIQGAHTFTVAKQTKVISTGSTIIITRKGETKAAWSGQDTGSGGQPVYEGGTVFVNDVKVQFK
jgi:hypothetical protein